METNDILSIKSALKNPLFKDAQVIGGNGGLQRNLRWVHILEVLDIETLVHGNEMILSTGIGFTENMTSFVSYLNKLIELKVSCLCLEMGQYLKFIPKEVIQIANNNNFPLIIFTKAVRFVDITQDLHTLIINHHYKMLQNLERISREFHRLTLESQGTRNVLELLHSSTKCPIIYLPIQKTPKFIPHLSLHKQKEILLFLNKRLLALDSNEDESVYNWKFNDDTILIRPVGAMGQTWAYLCLVKNQEPTEYDFLLLDSASISIAQDLLKTRYIEERQLHTENLWVNDLVNNRLKDELRIKTQLGQNYKSFNELEFCVCIIEIQFIGNKKEDMFDSFSQSTGLHLSMVVSSVFKQHSFQPFITLQNNCLVILAINLLTTKQTRDTPHMKHRFNSILKDIENNIKRKKTNKFEFCIGVGSSYTGLKNAHISYEEATKSLFLKPFNKSSIILYEELGVFQLLLNLQKESMLESYILSHIGPLIEEDRKRKSDLLRTLQAFVESNGSKKLAAEQLHIVRQSLYYRLEKIKELLGEDFMSSQNRLALQLAIQAYQFLNPSKL
jgi:purine catabolism regulator